MDKQEALKEIERLKEFVENCEATVTVFEDMVLVDGDKNHPLVNCSIDQDNLDRGSDIVCGAFRDRLPKGWEFIVEDGDSSIWITLRKVKE